MRDRLGRLIKGHHMSKETKEKLRLAHLGKPHLAGSKNPMWRGGKSIVDGYIYIYQPNHPFATKKHKNNKRKIYVLESHLVMEKYLGRYLKPPEVVHHKNGNRMDNRIENLKLFPNHAVHIKIHPRKRNELGQFI